MPPGSCASCVPEPGSTSPTAASKSCPRWPRSRRSRSLRRWQPCSSPAAAIRCSWLVGTVRWSVSWCAISTECSGWRRSGCCLRVSRFRPSTSCSETRRCSWRARTAASPVGSYSNGSRRVRPMVGRSSSRDVSSSPVVRSSVSCPASAVRVSSPPTSKGGSPYGTRPASAGCSSCQGSRELCAASSSLRARTRCSR